MENASLIPSSQPISRIYVEPMSKNEDLIKADPTQEELPLVEHLLL